MAKKKKSRKGRKQEEAAEAAATAPETPEADPTPKAASEEPPAPPTSRAPVWPMWVLMVLMLIGAGVGVYMANHHEVQLYGDESMQGELWGCAEAEGVSCDIVNTSEWSEVFGVPTFAWAVPTYLLVLGLAGAVARGRREFLWPIVAIGFACVGFSGFLYYISKVELGYVCLWCMRLYAINAAIPVLAGLSQAHKSPMPDVKALGMAGGAFALMSMATVGVAKGYRSTLLKGVPEIPELTQSVAPAAEGEIFQDPAGPGPEIELQIQTEDKNQRTLRARPTDAWKGNKNAKVSVIEFADLECGYCKRASGDLKRLYEVYKDRVVFVFKHFPMDPKCNPGVNNPRHRRACKAAVAAKCAQQQGRFWAFHDLAFKNQHQLKPDNLRFYAGTVGMDLDAYDRCVRDPSMLAAVKRDGQDGKEIDAHGTPRIFINGKLYRSGSSAQQMARAIELALGASAAEAAQGARAVAEEREAIAPIPPDVPEMRRITHGGMNFEIDTFEAALENGKAKVGKHLIPATRMSWFAARDACKSAGKRLCSEEEWIAACQSMRPVDDDGDGQFADDMVEGNAYPYSDYHSRGRCWDGHDRNAHRPVYTGEMPGCATGDGVYDLTGNVEEWVGTTPETAVLLGGAYDTSKDHARCYRRNDTFGPGLANKRTGFRCCR